MSEITYQVKIADATGHTVAQMTKPEIVAKANASQGTWVFVNDRLVSASELAAMTFADSDQFKVMPGLVGGDDNEDEPTYTCLLYTSPSPRDRTRSRMPSSA